MALGWKVLLPVALAYIMIIATAIYVIEDLMHITRPLVQQGILAGLSLLLGVVVFVLMDRNTVISGSQMKKKTAYNVEGSTLNVTP
jgi:predicted transcriptional regulator